MRPLSNESGVGDRAGGCAGTYRNRTIRVDCGRCGGRQDLADRTCLLGVLRILSRHPSAERVELAGVWDVAYDNDTLAMLDQLGRVLRSLEAMGSSAPSNHACRQCASSPAKISARALLSFPSRPSTDSIVNDGAQGVTCEECVSRTRSVMAVAGREYGKFESSLTKKAFKVVGGGKDARDASAGTRTETDR